MALNPYWGEGAPWGSRILTSYLVYLCPISTSLAFYIVNLISLLLSTIVLMLLCKDLGMRNGLPIAAAASYLFSSGVEWQIKEIWFNDAISHLFLVLMIYSMLKKYDAWVCLFSLLGALNRTTALYFLPVWYIYRFGWSIHLRNIRYLIFVWSPPVIITILIHALWFPLTSYSCIKNIGGFVSNYNFFEFYFEDFFLHTSSFNDFVDRIFSLNLANNFFGILLPLFLVAVFRLKNHYKILSIWIVIVWLQFFVARDVGRLETYAFPAMIPISLLYVAQSIQSATYQKITALVIIVLSIFLPISCFFIMGCIISAFVFYIGENRINILTVSLDIEKEQITSNQNNYFLIHIPCILMFLTFVWFGAFCMETYTLRPRPIFGYPQSLINQQNKSMTLGVADSKGNLRSIHNYSNKNTNDLSMITISESYEQIIIPLEDMEKTDAKLTFLLKMWGTIELGNRLYVDLGFVDGKELIPTFNQFSQISSNYSINHFSQLFFLYRLKNENCLIIGRDNTWKGRFQFMLFDVTHITRKTKESPIKIKVTF